MEQKNELVVRQHAKDISKITVQLVSTTDDCIDANYWLSYRALFSTLL
jgi:hypothetical protein